MIILGQYDSKVKNALPQDVRKHRNLKWQKFKQLTQIKCSTKKEAIIYPLCSGSTLVIVLEKLFVKVIYDFQGATVSPHCTYPSSALNTDDHSPS